MTEQDEIKQREVMGVLRKLGIAITNSTAVTLNEAEVKLLSLTSIGDLMASLTYESFSIH